jgi:transposase-like protein
MAKKKEKIVKEERGKGRPTNYSPELANRICEEISKSNRGLVSICAQEGMPSRTTVHEWLIKYKDFADKYARAREDQADYLAEEILSIADDGTKDTTQNERGNDIEDKEWTNRSKLRVEARKWIASKLKPKKYGDKLDLTTDGEKVSAPIIINWSGESNEKKENEK